MAVQLSGMKNHKTVITQSDYAMKNSVIKKDRGGSDFTQGGRSFNIGSDSDAVLMRKEIARKRAKKAVKDAWEGDRKIQSDIETRKENLRELRSDISQKAGYLMAYHEKKAELKEEYGIDENSEEQKVLLAKREQSLVNPEVVLTQAEQKRLAGIDEYEARVREMNQASFDIWIDKKPA